MRRLGVAIATTVVIAACSIPTDDTAQVIAQESLAPSLQQNPTTTTSTTLPTILTREFAYFLLADPDTEQRTVRQVVAPIEQGSLFEAIDPMDVEGFKTRIGADESLFNLVDRYDVVDVRLNDGIATVFLLTLGDAPDNPVLRDVAAQLVWTLTGEEDVDAVLINIDGDPAELPTTNDDNLTNSSVRPEDYELYDPERQDETTTTTTSTTTTTTVPPEDG